MAGGSGKITRLQTWKLRSPAAKLNGGSEERSPGSAGWGARLVSGNIVPGQKRPLSLRDGRATPPLAFGAGCLPALPHKCRR